MSSSTGVDLAHVRVHDAMHPGIISVRPEMSVRAVARLMAERHVHAVAVTTAGNSGRPGAIVSALDVVAAATADIDQMAGEVAATKLLTIGASERLEHAAQLMAEHEVDHLIVTDSASGHPIGVLSTLDIAAVCGG